MVIRKESEDIIASVIRMRENGITPMEEEDYEKALIVTRELKDVPFYQNSNHIEIEEAIERSLDYMKRYPNIKDKLNLFEEVDVYPFIKEDDYEELYYQTTIDPITFKAKKLFMPLFPNEQSPIYIAHEIHHILKDTNKEEYKGKLKYADVLPLLFECLVGEEKREIITNRIYMLNSRKEVIENHIKNKNKNPLQDLLDSNLSQYYLSFYYAILLLERYHKQPERMLEKVSSVLRHESTTEQLLQDENLIHTNQNELVKEKMKYYTKTER